MAQAEAGSVYIRLAANAGEFRKGVNAAGGSMDALAKKAQKLGLAIGAAFATQQVLGFAKSAIGAFAKQEDSIRSVEAAILTTGGTAGRTSKQLQAMASQLQRTSTFGDEDTLKQVTTNLLTFGNVVGPVFDRAQAAALDLSTVLQQDLKSSTIQLGKALNDPIKGITALSRVGIAFTEQQKQQIKTLVESGKIMEAQGVILQEIEHYYGQAAETAARTTGGQLKQAAMAFGDAVETVGSVIAPILLPAAHAIQSLAESFQAASPEMQRFLVIGTGVVAVLGPVTIAAGVLAAALGAIAAPVAAVVAGIGVLSGALAAFYPNIRQLALHAYNGFKALYDSAKQWLVDALEPIVRRVSNTISYIAQKFQALRVALGFEAAQQASNEGMRIIVDNVKSGLDKLSGYWQVAADEAEKEAPALSDKMAAAALLAAQKIEQASARSTVAATAAADAQRKLADAGVQLVEGQRDPHELEIDKLTKLQAAYDAGRISAQQLANAQKQAAYIAQSAYAGMASNIAGSLQQIFSQSKAVAIATALINSYEAATKALAAYPPPFNYVAAAATFAAGLAQVANIRKTSKSSSGGGGGGASAPAVSAAGAPQAVQINLSGERFGRQQVFDLIDQINAAGRDGKQVITTQARAA